MNVTKDNFLEALPSFTQHLEEASFVAVDLEFTGITLSRDKNGQSRHIEKADTPKRRFDRVLRDIVQTYSIIQVGVCVFAESPGGSPRGMVATPYNFYVFPTSESALVTLNVGSIQFL